ncbi:hypothetical protein NLJ89_g3925 [Agrocybe chaxingu]|uniref:Uncharacterized protein n=1 Tax=Agrocybe chaxingu TaxID=84603 RepID=A0A9W8MWF2_9AGAR|nr:hypothetical protein NLJ89_g3925 [Agrocybe chaxingu]
MVFNSNPSNSSQESNPLIQQQLDTLSANTNSVNATLQQVIQQQKDTEDWETTKVYYLTNLINSTQSEIMMLQTSIDHQESLKLLLPPNDPRVQGLDDHTAHLQHRISKAESHKRNLTMQLQAKQLMLATASPTATSFMEPVTISDQDQQMSLAPLAPVASMPEASTSNKRPCLEDDQSEVHEQQEVEPSMQVDDGLQLPLMGNG